MYVYRLRSITYPTEIYIGVTENPPLRLKDHKSKRVAYTSQFTPWKFEIIIWIPNREKAFKLERYLKSHSGRAFAAKHFC